ncbi:MAG: hypothetical protein FJZ15_02140 [Candidatus Omnitrophica bacterium]|nr:hypothetical protein [Candidatus Omnitrophota bacterium]
MNHLKNKFGKLISLIAIFNLLFQQLGFAQMAGPIDISRFFGKPAAPQVLDISRLPHLRYYSYNNLDSSFRFLVDNGYSNNKRAGDINKEAKDAYNYFLTGITLANKDFWVNLRPDSASNIIDNNLAMTDMGRVMLEADVQLKKDTANFTSPATPTGKLYWNKLYKKAQDLYGMDQVTIPTLTRPWIVPGEVIVHYTNSSAYVYKATLKVMLEQDYLKNSAQYNFEDSRAKELNEYSSQLIRDLIIPQLTKEVNTSSRYAKLRQVYYSLILAQWFKGNFNNSVKNDKFAGLIDKGDLTGITSAQSWSPRAYFEAYQKSFKDGEYKLQESVSTINGQVVRTYFSGGIQMAQAGTGAAVSSVPVTGTNPLTQQVIDASVKNGTATPFKADKDGIKPEEKKDSAGFDGMPNDDYTADIRLALTNRDFAAVEMRVNSEQEYYFRQVPFMIDAAISGTSLSKGAVEASEQRIKLTNSQLAVLKSVIDETWINKDLLMRDKLTNSAYVLIFTNGQKAHRGLGRPQIYLDVNLLASSRKEELKKILSHDFAEREFILEDLELQDSALFDELKLTLTAPEDRSPELNQAIADISTRVHDQLTSVGTAEAINGFAQIREDSRGFDGLPNDDYTPGIRAAIESGNFALLSVGRVAKTTETLKPKMMLGRDKIDLLDQVIMEMGIANELEGLTLIFIPGQKAHYGVGRAQIYLDIDLLDASRKSELKEKLYHELKERNEVLASLKLQNSAWLREVEETRENPLKRSADLKAAIEKAAKTAHDKLINSPAPLPAEVLRNPERMLRAREWAKANSYIFGGGFGYDIRINDSLKDTEDIIEFFYLLGLEYGSGKEYLNHQGTALITGEQRYSSRALRLAFVQGLLDAGIDVTTQIETEAITSGLTSRKGLAGNFDLVAQVTGSHNPQPGNGTKMTLRGFPVFGPALATLMNRIINQEGISDVVRKGKLTIQDDLVEEHIQALARVLPKLENPSSAIVDFRRGAGGSVFTGLAERMGYEIVRLASADAELPGIIFTSKKPVLIVLNEQPSAAMEAGIWDPSKPESFNDIKKLQVRIYQDSRFKGKKFTGIVLDGDGDRAGFNMEGEAGLAGDLVMPDRMLMSYFNRFVLANVDGIKALNKLGHTVKLALDVRASGTITDVLENISNKEGIRVEGEFIPAGFPNHRKFVLDEINVISGLLEENGETIGIEDRQAILKLIAEYTSAEASGHFFFNVLPQVDFLQKKIVVDDGITSAFIYLNLVETMDQFELPGINDSEKTVTTADNIFPSLPVTNEVRLEKAPADVQKKQELAEKIVIEFARTHQDLLPMSFDEFVRKVEAARNNPPARQNAKDALLLVDGIRLRLNNGAWFLFRKSNTSAVITFKAEATDAKFAGNFVKMLRDLEVSINNVKRSDPAFNQLVTTKFSDEFLRCRKKYAMNILPNNPGSEQISQETQQLLVKLQDEQFESGLRDGYGKPQAQVSGKWAKIGFDTGDKKDPNRLGWTMANLEWVLNNPEKIDQVILDGTAITENYDDVIIFGMGGSGLGVEVVKTTFGEKTTRIWSIRTTDPAVIKSVLDKIAATKGGSLRNALEKTLAVVISKSGTTQETVSHLKYFEDLLDTLSIGREDHIWVVTDKGSPMDTGSYEQREIQLNAKGDIGGRFTSPTTNIFLLPMAIVAPERIKTILNRAKQMNDISDVQEDTFLKLGAYLYQMSAKYGRDKVTLIFPEEFKSLPIWMEQLFEESLGKDGKGVTLFYGEKLSPEVLKPAADSDRVFVRLNIGGRATQVEFGNYLRQNDYPVFDINVNDINDIGGLMLGFERTVATIGYLWDICFVNQPAVENYKKATRAVMAGLKPGERVNVPFEWKSAQFKALKLYYSPLLDIGAITETELAAEVKSLNADMNNAPAVMAAVINLLRSKGKNFEAVELMSYGQMTDGMRMIFEDARSQIFTKSLGMPTKLGEGPDKNHSFHQNIEGGKDMWLSLYFMPLEIAQPEALIYDDNLLRAQTIGTAMSLKDMAKRKVMLLTADSTTKAAESDVLNFFVQVKDYLNGEGVPARDDEPETAPTPVVETKQSTQPAEKPVVANTVDPKLAAILKAISESTLPVTLRVIGEQTWLDGLTFEMLENGLFEALVSYGIVTGVTTNPTLIKKYVADPRVQQKMKELSAQGKSQDEVYFEIVKDLALRVKAVFDKAGKTGKFSVELNPTKANDVEASVKEAMRWTDIAPDMMMVKVGLDPNSDAAYQTIQRVIGEGRNVNATLIFSPEQYRKVALAYIAGLKDALAAGKDISKIYSVASFFISRWDIKFAKEIPAEYHGMFANAIAISAYNNIFKELFESAEFKELQRHGAKVQDFLLASTGTKAKDLREKVKLDESLVAKYPADIYFSEVMGKNVVNTLPWEALEYIMGLKISQPRSTITLNAALAEEVLSAMRAKGVDIEAAGQELLKAGLDSFVKDFNAIQELIATIIKESQAGNSTQAGPGGIDFRYLNLSTQAQFMGLKPDFKMPSLSALKDVDIRVEAGQLRRMMDAGIAPSAQRVIDYISACYIKGGNTQVNEAAFCLTELFRYQEDNLIETDSELKAFLMVMDAS